METIAEQRAPLSARRDNALKGMSDLVDLSDAEGRTFTPEEQTSFDQFEADGNAVTEQLRRLDAREKLIAASARPAVSTVQTGSVTPHPSIQMRDTTVPKGTSFARYVMALIASRGNMLQAEQIARNYWRDTTPQLAELFRAIGQCGSAEQFVKQTRAAVSAGSTANPAWGGALVYAETMASEFIELLRPATILGRLTSLRKVPFNVRMVRQLGGVSTAGWVGQGMSKPVGDLSMDAITMPWTKVAVIVAMTEELARFSDPSAESVVNDDMVASISQFLDGQFINPTNAPVAGVNPGAITHGVTPITSTGSTVAQVTADLGTMLQNMASAGIPMNAPAWIMNPREAIYLSLLRGATDAPAFPSMATGNTLLGYPVVTSNTSPLGQIVLLDQRQIFLADEGGVTLDVSREASLQLDSAPSTPPAPLTSLWQQNLIGIKAERFIYWMRRYDAAVQMMTGAPY